jgi:hypothetical protein
MRVVDLKPDAEMLKEVREYFPHRDVRRYQADLANSVYEALLAGEKNIVVEAPTGLGKGPDAVSPNPLRLPRARSRGGACCGNWGSCSRSPSGPPDRPPRYMRGPWPMRRRTA